MPRVHGLVQAAACGVMVWGMFSSHTQSCIEAAGDAVSLLQRRLIAGQLFTPGSDCKLGERLWEQTHMLHQVLFSWGVMLCSSLGGG